VALGLIPFLGPLSKAKKAGKALKVAKTAGRIASAKVKEKVEVKLREPPPAEGVRGYERGRDFERMNSRLRDLDQEGRTVHTPHPERNPQNTRDFRQDRIEGAQRHLRSNPEKLRRYLDRVDRSDVDHVHPLGLGGQDIRSNMTFRESGANRSMGTQTGAQTRNHPAGTRVHFD
jgi:5-methylcytosine-specific restriction endonuclease McrA